MQLLVDMRVFEAVPSVLRAGAGANASIHGNRKYSNYSDKEMLSVCTISMTSCTSIYEGTLCLILY